MIPEDAARDLSQQADQLILDTHRLLHVAFVARQLACHPETVRAWIRRDLIAFVKLPGGRYRITAAECARLLHERRSLTQTPQTSQSDAV